MIRHSFFKFPLGSWQAAARIVATMAIVVGAASSASRAAVEEPAPAVAERNPEKPEVRQGLAVLAHVTLPLESGSVDLLKSTLERARDRLVEAARAAQDGRRPTLVIEFAPARGADDGGVGSQFEAAYSLARFLSRDMGEVRTVAWLPRSIRGHAVLAAIACEEIAMPADAEIGEAGADETDQGAVSPTIVAAYREIAELRGSGVPAALAEGMVDPAAEVLQVESEDGLRFVLRGELEEFRRDHEVLSEQVKFPPGTLARFTGREARNIGFVRHFATDRATLAEALAVPAASLEEDQSLQADWHPIVLDVRDKITQRTVSEFNTLLHNERGRGPLLVAVRIESVGGDPAACVELAANLAALKPEEVRTIAYVPVEARGGAAVVALACQELVMHPEAKLGAGPDVAAIAEQNNRRLPPPGPPFGRRRRPPPPPEGADMQAETAAAVASIRDSLAAQTNRSWSLLAAMFDPSIEVFRYRNKASGAERLMSADEVTELPDAADWVRGAALQQGNQPLTLTGARVVEVGLAKETVDSFDGLERLFNAKFREVQWNWALSFVRTLAHPTIAMFLLFLGFIGLWIEVKTPGVGVGGMVSAVAFLLFFWSKYLDQTAETLEIVMFVCGIVLMLIEVFVVPGMGVFGLGGALMVIFSIILASQTFVIPASQAQMNELTQSLATLATAGIAMVALALATRRYLPKAPIFNRLVLEPPPPEERVSLSHRESLADYSHLVGVSGEAATDLMLAGKALIDDQLIDVIAEGAPIDRGTRIVVTATHGPRVVVRAAI